MVLVAVGGVFAFVVGYVLGGLITLAGEGETTPTRAADLMMLAAAVVFPALLVMVFRLRLGATLALAAIVLGLAGIAADPILRAKGEVVVWWLLPSAFLVSGWSLAWWRSRRAYRPPARPRCGTLPIALSCVAATLALTFALAVWSLDGVQVSAGGAPVDWLSGVVVAWAVCGGLAFLAALLLRRWVVAGVVLALIAAAVGMAAPWEWVGDVLNVDVWPVLPRLWLVVVALLVAAAASALRTAFRRRLVGGAPSDVEP